MNVRVVSLGIAAFALALVAVLPMNWVKGWLPDGIRCEQWRGSVWRGDCSGLTVTLPGIPPQNVDNLRWDFHPLALLRLTASADFATEDAHGGAEGRVGVGAGGRISAQNLSARGLLDNRIIAALPRGWRGQFRISGLELELAGPELRELAGELHLDDFRDARGGDLGSFVLQFPPGGAPPFKGTLRDQGGPFEVLAYLTVAADRSWVLDGTVQPRAGADPALSRQLEMLGGRDAAGRYRISAAGDFR